MDLTKEDKDLMRMSLDDLITDDMPDEIVGTTEETEALKPSENSAKKYEGIKIKAEKKAKKTITSLLKFYLDEHIINQEEYVSSKVELMQMGLTKLIWLMETSENSMNQLLVAIDSGDIHPRLFEVLGQLQKTMLDVIKSQTMYMVASEEEIKKLGRDIEMYSSTTNTSSENKKVGPSKGISSRGTKDLMKAIHSITNPKVEEDEDDAEIISDEEINGDDI
jgi:hypothetical protein